MRRMRAFDEFSTVSANRKPEKTKRRKYVTMTKRLKDLKDRNSSDGALETDRNSERSDRVNTHLKYSFESSPLERDFSVTKVDCRKIINGDKAEIAKGITVTVKDLPEPEIDLSIYMELKHNCDKFKRQRGYILHHLSEEERAFPIAVSVLFYKDFHQVEKLLRIIYRPHNYYCLHVDLTADPRVHAVVRAYADCFENVLTPKDVINIKWGSFSIAEAEFLCMYELLKYKKWKYLINLTGQEFPLKTNRQMVQIFKELKGANDLWTSPMQAQKLLYKTRLRFRPPRGIYVIKGAAHFTLSRAFVKFATSDERVLDLASYLHDRASPEESLWTTLNNDATLRAPGGFNGTLVESIRKPYFGREKWWLSMKKSCTGRYTRNICIYGVGDIQRLTRASPIVANKFHWNSQPMALACMREWLYNRTRDEYLGRYKFDLSIYKNTPSVRQMYKSV